MSHTRDHIIIQKIRAFITSWPLSTTGAAAAIGILTRFIG